ncbi:general secretion pathway protein GspB [Haliea sp. E1-2-M8]|uniref:general secretion pathway protein GspB n=1 Tax=Haliea sp. E1-2-M8 TaxID=3064706 RepID=UPI002720865F|nr:general secretion pathway protein GspB [Haliea sp. E1-2-M8]MDO8863211.1 general secretion pathway protein GspB [Haliea sp. E1-2-M8]
MSLILEALNRARREQHNAAPVPGVDSEHYYPSVDQSPWRQRGMLAALALALLVIGVLLGREFSRGGAEAPVSPAERQPVVTETPESLAAPPPVPATPEPEAEPAMEAQQPQEAQDTPVVPEQAPETDPEMVEPVVAASPAQPPPSTAGTGTSAEVAALYQQSTAPEEASEPAPAAATASEEPVDIASLVTAAEQALEDVRLTEHSAPFLGDLSQQRKDAVPTLMYLQHDYRSEGESTVTINGQQARAGQSVGRGVTVEEILPDSVVLSHAGEQFRLRALNSWVNL